MDKNVPVTQGTEDEAPSRRGVLKCMLWAGTGIVWTVSGGVPRSLMLGGEAQAATSDFTFVQVSDSHIGFKLDPNPAVADTFKLAFDDIGKLPKQPAFVLHTGDMTHLSKADQFDTADQIMKSYKHEMFFTPGEHDVIGDDGKQFFERFGKGSKTPWYSFDQGGIHFVGLMNVLNFKPGGQAHLGDEQLAWLAADLKGKTDSTPIVVFAHMPLWPIYEPWGWATDDADHAFAMMKRFGSVTTLNGHIHQVVQKVEGNLAFYTATSTAFPQPPAGQGPAPGPMKVAAEQLKSTLGIRQIDYVKGKSALAVVDSKLG